MSVALDLPRSESVATAACAHARQTLAAANAYVCEDDGQHAVEIAAQLRAQRDQMQGERDVIDDAIAPLKKASLRWKPAIDDLDAARRIMLEKGAAKKRALAHVQQAALVEARTVEEVQAAVQVLAAPLVGVHERTNWGWRVTDLALVPDEYFVLDEKRLDREARERKAGMGVPGIEPVATKVAVQR